MSQTNVPKEKYGWKDLLYNVLTSLVLMALGGWLSFLFAPEEICCERQRNQVASCELQRVVLGVPVWGRRLDGLREAKVRYADENRTRTGRGGKSSPSCGSASPAITPNSTQVPGTMPQRCTVWREPSIRC